MNTSYFDTGNFYSEFNGMLELLIKSELVGLDEEEAINKLEIKTKDIREYRARYGDLSSQIEYFQEEFSVIIEQAKAENNEENVKKYTDERDKQIQQLTNIFENDEYVKEKVKNEKEDVIHSYFKQIEEDANYFNQLKDILKYYLVNVETGDVFTNLEVSKKEGFVDNFFKGDDILYVREFSSKADGNLHTHGYLIPELRYGNGEFEGKIGIQNNPDILRLGVFHNYEAFMKEKKAFLTYVIGGAVSLLIGLLLMRRVLKNRTVSGKRFPIDVHALSFVLLAVLYYFLLEDTKNLYLSLFADDPYPVWKFIKSWFFIIMVGGLTLVVGTSLPSRFTNFTNFKEDVQNSFLFRGYKRLIEAFLIKSIGTQAVLLSVFIFATIPLLCLIGQNFGAIEIRSLFEFALFYIPSLLLFIPIVVMIIKKAGYFNKIVLSSSELVKGNLDQNLEVKGKSQLALLANNINQLKQGVKVSMSEQAKSERLKTELITNVSHDLRTPLTSIISYTELLKQPDLSREDLQSYIEIIDRKSKRLKVLIEDLFEVSKMASGSMELTKERININQLLQQVLGEQDEAIQKSTLQFRVSYPESPVYAVIDGQKFWRVFDNLIGNILKYSLESTRVYISIKAENSKATITFKNVTKYELGEDANELFERFKRGDASRNTDGSGLGLAIAKSIIDLHDGDMKIEVDGDLFKVTIILEAEN